MATAIKHITRMKRQSLNFGKSQILPETLQDGCEDELCSAVVGLTVEAVTGDEELRLAGVETAAAVWAGFLKEGWPNPRARGNKQSRTVSNGVDINTEALFWYMTYLPIKALRTFNGSKRSCIRWLRIRVTRPPLSEALSS